MSQTKLCLLSIVLFAAAGCKPSVYTPAVFPPNEADPKKEIRGPATTSFAEAQQWAVNESRRIGPSTQYIVYRDLYWNEKYGMEMAKEKLK
jgi:hypothetical protein